MQITITKDRSEDRIALVRADGSRAETRFPKKGAVPHDAVHFFVERGLGLRSGFWGMVAAGRHPEELGTLTKAGGHASASRAGLPDAGIVELLQAERIVECFEAQLWSGQIDAAGLIALAETACGYSHVPPPSMPQAAVAQIGCDLSAFVRDWTVAPQGYSVILVWE
jgi:hypothetical protein